MTLKRNGSPASRSRSTGLSDREKRIAAFQAEIDALPQAGYSNVIDLDGRFTIEYRGEIGWETKQGQGHVGLFKTSGEAVNAAWELRPWSLAALATSAGGRTLESDLREDR